MGQRIREIRRQWQSFARLDPWWRASGLFPKKNPPLCQVHPAGESTLPERQKGYGIALGSFDRGATPSEYLDRLDLQNRIFDDDIRLERIVIRNDKPIIVTSQPAIKGVAPTQIALDELMAGKGYEKLTDGAYYDERAGLLIFDLFPRNAIQAANGHIYPIDPVIQRITPEFAQFLREHPDTINLIPG